MKFLPLLLRFPKWVAVSLIVIVPSAIFVSWWMMRALSKPPSSAPNANLVPEETVTFDLQSSVLCGNTLVNYRTGEILSREWLEGFAGSLPPLAGIFPDDKLVIAANRGLAAAYGYDGKQKPLLSVDGKPIGAAAYSSSRPTVIFVKDGDVWSGTVDWVHSQVKEPKRVTDVGYFKNNLFNGEYFLTEDELYVSILGKTSIVSLTSGSIKQLPISVSLISRGASPDQKLSAFPLGHGKCALADFTSGELKNVPVAGEVKQVKWLSPTRVAIICNYRELVVYDHQGSAKPPRFQTGTRSLKLPQSAPEVDIFSSPPVGGHNSSTPRQANFRK